MFSVYISLNGRCEFILSTKYIIYLRELSVYKSVILFYLYIYAQN